MDYRIKSKNEDLFNYVNFCYALNLPNSFEEAMEKDDNLKWIYVMYKKIKSLEKNNVCCNMKLPENKKLEEDGFTQLRAILKT